MQSEEELSLITTRSPLARMEESHRIEVSRLARLPFAEDLRQATATVEIRRILLASSLLSPYPQLSLRELPLLTSTRAVAC